MKVRMNRYISVSTYENMYTNVCMYNFIIAIIQEIQDTGYFQDIEIEGDSSFILGYNVKY